MTSGHKTEQVLQPWSPHGTSDMVKAKKNQPGGPTVKTTVSPESRIMLTMSSWCRCDTLVLLTYRILSPTCRAPLQSAGLCFTILPTNDSSHSSSSKKNSHFRISSTIITNTTATTTTSITIFGFCLTGLFFSWKLLQFWPDPLKGNKQFFTGQMLFSALTLLVGWQEGHPACKMLGVGWSLVTIWQELSTSYSSTCHHHFHHP